VRLRLLIPVALVAAAAAFLLLRGGDEEPQTQLLQAPPPPCEQFNPPVELERDIGKPPKTPPPGKLVAVVRTNCGKFEIALDSERFPRTVASFVHLAEHDFYVNTSVHRIVPGQFIEAGDPSQTGFGGPGYAVTERVPPTTRYPRLTVAMSNPRSDIPGMSGSAFFIVTGREAELPAQYAILGRVIGGKKTINKIASQVDPSGTTEQPVVSIFILGVSIERR